MRFQWAGVVGVAMAAMSCGGKVNGPAHGSVDGGAGGHPGVQGAGGAAAIAGGDPGGSDGAFPSDAMCGNTNCGFIQIEGVLTASTCCGANGRCGAALVPAEGLGPIAAGCVEFQQRGKPDPTCPDAMLANALGIFTLSGCCRASGTCGMAVGIEQLPSFGCVDRAAWGLDSARACAANPTCNDGVKDFGETDRDCGGPDCPACGDAENCAADADCVTGYCSARGCVVPDCGDGVRNGSESDVDCGTGCAPCPAGNRCRIDADCRSNSCAGAVCR